MALLKKEIPDASASAINGPPVKKRLLGKVSSRAPNKGRGKWVLDAPARDRGKTVPRDCRKVLCNIAGV